MLHHTFSEQGRKTEQKTLSTDLVVIGGGLAGVCCAISAARQGLSVSLIQDRPVLGGNASSEVRLWALGATSHMGNNNRWSREGGIIDELLVENLYRNKEGNTLIFDTILLEKVKQESNITLLLNTAVFATHKETKDKIKAVSAFCSQNSTLYEVSGQYFCDASGDGLVAFQAGAEFRIGAESKSEFDEGMAPDVSNTELLGHSLYFYSKDVGKPVTFVPPSYAGMDRMTEDRVKRIRSNDVGPKLWWLEYGGNMDTIFDSEDIKWELWKIVYGIWDYIKNSGKFENVENLTLEWVGTIPGKRESRRFMGHSFMVQRDIVEQKPCDDAISFGGWAIDHHPGDGVYSEKPPCTQFHAKGVYQIPLGAFISKDISNLFLAGRIVSVSHIAFGSTRVMATTAHGGQAVGAAVAQCIKQQVSPETLLMPQQIDRLQQSLNRSGHFIPDISLHNENNLLSQANLKASSEWALQSIPSDSTWHTLNVSCAQLLPLKKQTKYTFTVTVNALEKTSLTVQLRVSERQANFTPEKCIEEQHLSLSAGKHTLELMFSETLSQDQYGFVCFMQNPNIQLPQSNLRMTGIMTVFNGENKAVSNTGYQNAPQGLGVDSFEFWIPERRPGGKNISMQISPALKDFSAANVIGGYTRPYISSNAWIANLNDSSPQIECSWRQKQAISAITIHLDNDFDHALESSLYGHPEQVIPMCVNELSVLDGNNNVVHRIRDNHQTVLRIELDTPLETDKLTFRFKHPSASVPASVFAILVE